MSISVAPSGSSAVPTVPPATPAPQRPPVCEHLTPSSFGAPGYPGAPSLGVPACMPVTPERPTGYEHLTPSSFGAPGYPGAPSLGLPPRR